MTEAKFYAADHVGRDDQDVLDRGDHEVRHQDDDEVDREDHEEILPSPSDPMRVARKLLHDHETDRCLTLRSWRGGWMRWERSHWAEIENRELESTIYQRLEHAQYVDTSKKVPELKAWEPTRYKVANVVDAVAAVAFLPETVDAPSWLRPTHALPAGEMVACANGLLHVGTRSLLPLTPRFFNRVAVPFDYDPDAAEPARWIEFLNQLWPEDPDSIKAMQEFFGYVLSGRTDLHKIMLLIGPTRSGKGTIARVLAALIGKGNAAGPTLASLGTNFGLSPLLGKPLAVVSDARLGRGDEHQVVERLLSISGEDMLTVDRKYREPWTGKLPTRFLVLSNELPRFGDASGAIAARFVVLSMHQSFLGKENTRLTTELLAELPGILRWSLDGLDRLSRSSFTEPASSADSIIALQDLVSPVAAFVRDCCKVDAGQEVAVAAVFKAWREWADGNGHRPGSVQTFGRDLRAVIPQIRQVRPREGDERPRTYQGLSLSAANNGKDRGPSWTGTESEPVVRGGPRPNPMLSEHTSDCGHPSKIRALNGKCAECIADRVNAELSTVVDSCPVHGTELLPGRLCLDCAEGDPDVA
ncbi:MAG: phage/plasmid primase, P4 family [Actinomycetota bacterium]|nr:phage/plasmid primase, P4 family [Actinomycetota bacterium]